MQTLKVETDPKHYTSLNPDTLLSYFFKDNKDRAPILLSFLAFLPISSWLTFALVEGNKVNFFILFFLLISLGLYLAIISYIFKFYTWKKTVNQFKDQISGAAYFSISFNDQLIILSTAQVEKIWQWSWVRKFQMDDEHILIITDEYILIPKSAASIKSYYSFAKKLQEHVVYDSSKDRV